MKEQHSFIYTQSWFLPLNKAQLKSVKKKNYYPFSSFSLSPSFVLNKAKNGME